MKKINHITLITIILYIAITIFTNQINNYDELWNFCYANNIAKGLLPYKEFNMITTPLYPFLNSIILKLFDQKLYIFRITYITLFIFFIYIISKILKQLNIKKTIINIYLIIITFLLINTTYSDYNFFNMILTALIIYLELKNTNNNKKRYNIIIGIICSLVILTKQTTGLIISTTAILIPLIKNKNYKKAIIRLISILPCMSVFIIYLLKNNLTNSFIDLTILGLKTFNKSKLNIPTLIILLLLIIIIIYTIKNLLHNKNNTNNQLLLIYSLATFSINYPLLDPTHLTISIIPISIFFIKNHKFKLKVNIKAITITLILILDFISINKIINYKNNIKEIEKYNTYQYLISPRNDLQQITNFIKNNKQKVYIIGKDAIIYTTALNEYNQYFDIPLPGNIGTNGEKIMIKKLKQNNNILLISNKQEIKKNLPKLYKYIQNNYKTKDNFNYLHIYEKKSS